MTNKTTSVFDAAALAVVAGSWVDILPALAALIAAAWYALQIWESKTVKSWTGREETRDDEFSDGQM